MPVQVEQAGEQGIQPPDGNRKIIFWVLQAHDPAVFGSAGVLVIESGPRQVRQSFAVRPEQLPQVSWQSVQVAVDVMKSCLGSEHLQLPAVLGVDGSLVIDNETLQVRQSLAVVPEHVPQVSSQGSQVLLL